MWSERENLHFTDYFTWTNSQQEEFTQKHGARAVLRQQATVEPHKSPQRIDREVHEQD